MLQQPFCMTHYNLIPTGNTENIHIQETCLSYFPCRFVIPNNHSMKLLYSSMVVFLCLIASGVNAQVALNTINSPYEQNFNSLFAIANGTSDILPPGWLFSEAGTGANTTYGAGTGSSNAGNTYSFGLDASDRAFGGLLSGALAPTVGAGFTNLTGSTITSLQITYRGEQWRFGTINRGSDRLDFQYSFNATSLTTGTWTELDALDFSSPVTTGATGALNGNASGNNSTLSFTIDGISIVNGATFFIRWSDFNVAGADDGLAIDDFIIVPVGIPPTDPAITFTPSTVSFGEVNVGTSRVLPYNVNGDNLESPIAVAVTDAAYQVSADNISFASSTVLPDSGGTVYLKFSPTANGPANTSVTHISGAYSKNLTVTGSGYVQAENIIPIAVARAQSAGTKVTVAGRITVAFEQGNPAYIQDETGGIPVFDFALATSVSIGDSVWVTGPIGVFNDQKQISGAGIFHTLIAAPSRVPEPKPILLSELAANEGLLVSVQNVELVNKSFVFYPQSTERMTDGTLQADLRIDGDTDIPGLVKPQTPVNIIGVVGRFRTNAQLLPRFQQDIPGAVEPSLSSDSIPKTETLDVVNWNFEFFGARSEVYGEEYGPENELLQLTNIKRVLDSLHADIIAVQEISEDSLFASLVAQLGPYSFYCSPRYSRSFEGPSTSFPPQKVCFIYDTTTIQVLSSRALFEARYDSARTIDPSLLPGYPGGTASSFYSSGRLPAFIKLNATINGVTETISLINIHAKSGAAVDDRSRRAYDAAVLYDSLSTHFTSEKLIILGDLNDDLDQSISTGLPTPYAQFVDDTTHYFPVTKAMSDADAKSTVSFNDVIDHQIISNELRSSYLEGSVQIVTPFRVISNYAATTSDHLPVITRYKFQKPVVQFTQSIKTVTEDSTQFTLYVTLDKPVTTSKQLPITLSGEATEGDDFTVSPASAGGQITLTLNAGDSVASVVITIINDAIDELAETVVFSLGTTPGFETGEPSTFTLTIEDNDIPTIAFAERHASAEEGSGAYEINLKLSTPPATDQQTVIGFDGIFNTYYGSDFTINPAPSGRKITVQIPAGSTEASFTVTPLEDRKREFNEYILFYLIEASAGLQPKSPLLSIFTITDKKRHPHFTAFPNPTAGHFKLIADEVEDDEEVQVEIRNSFGQRVFRERGTVREINEKISHKFPLSKKGIYLMTVVLDGESFSVRIVKN